MPLGDVRPGQELLKVYRLVLLGVQGSLQSSGGLSQAPDSAGGTCTASKHDQKIQTEHHPHFCCNLTQQHWHVKADLYAFTDSTQPCIAGGPNGATAWYKGPQTVRQTCVGWLWLENTGPTRPTQMRISHACSCNRYGHARCS